MQQRLEADGYTPLPVALWLVRQIAQGLEALHASGWVHGDVKPENAIVGSRGHVTLVDRLSVFDIGDRTCHATHLVVRPGTKAQLSHGVLQQTLTSVIQISHLIELLSGERRIG